MIIEVQPTVYVKVTVLFEDPFWVGVVERNDEQGYQVARVVFGSEPTPPELYDHMLKYYGTFQFTTPSLTDLPEYKKVNYKRAQREAKRVAVQQGVGTKAQEAVRLKTESRTAEQKAAARQRAAEDAQKKFALKQEKRREKHKGH